MLKKAKTIYICRECGAEASKWSGQCGECNAWNTLEESVSTPPVARPGAKSSGYAGAAGKNQAVMLFDVKEAEWPRFQAGLDEFDRVLGGGVVPGSVTLIGGDPGIGKSTLLLQCMANLADSMSVLYVSGEESAEQISLRARRLGLGEKPLQLLTEVAVEQILAVAAQQKPKLLVIDSIQTIYTYELRSAPGGVAQVRECAAQLVQWAKQNNVALFVVGHVTKEGALAGPRVLEHMVDAVLYFEGERDSRFRVIRAVKNRFGAVNELGVFAMTEQGLKPIANPSAIFLRQDMGILSGSAITSIWEGTRPLLIEVQALVDSSQAQQPRRLAVGFDSSRLVMLLAILHRHAGIVTSGHDVFLNVVGGIKILETSVDLAICAAVVASLRDIAIGQETLILGEVGLAGEIRPVQNGQQRLKEAAKHGLKKAIVPKANLSKQMPENIQVIGVQTIAELVKALS